MTNKNIKWSEEVINKRAEGIKKAHKKKEWCNKIPRCPKCGVFMSKEHKCKTIKEKQRNAKLLNPTKYWLGKRRTNLWTEKNARRRENQYARTKMERHLGKKLNPQQVVHHINGNFKDHRIENLIVLPNQSEHMKLHIKQGDLNVRRF